MFADDDAVLVGRKRADAGTRDRRSGEQLSKEKDLGYKYIGAKQKQWCVTLNV